MPTPTIVNVGYRSTNYWVVSAGTSRLLVDLGWPGMVDALRHALSRADVPLGELRHGFATHYHMDHAGAAEDLKRLGMTLVVFEPQLPAIAAMKAHLKPQDRYTEITSARNLVLPCADSRPWLHSLGIAGEVVPTPGHSDDHVSLVLDDGACFTGDLTRPEMVGAEDPAVIAASWQRLRDLGATTVYPGHGPVYPLPPG